MGSFVPFPTIRSRQDRKQPASIEESVACDCAPAESCVHLIFSADGGCTVQGFGEINSDMAETVAKNLLLLASAIRHAATMKPKPKPKLYRVK